MLDKKIIKTKIVNIEHYKKEIEMFLPKDAKVYNKSNLPIKRLVERDLCLISDIEYDILSLIYKGLEIAVVGNENSLLQKLRQKLGTKITNNIEQLRILRNNLTHAYADYNYDEEVYKQASSLNNVAEFINEVKNLISSK